MDFSAVHLIREKQKAKEESWLVLQRELEMSRYHSFVWHFERK